MLDIYFEPEYGKLYEDIEHGTCEIFDFSSEHGIIRNMFIKRPVPWLVNGVQYYDIVTPYGYGGPVIIKYNADKDTLTHAYMAAFKNYCSKERIVAEFIRFHPLLENSLDWDSQYRVNFCRNSLAINLKDENYQFSQFSSDCRNMIRKAVKKGVEISIDTQCEGMEGFYELYTMTMDKNNASKYYYFPLHYFDSIRNQLKGSAVLINAHLEGKLIASSLFMISDNYMHYHLSATNREFYSYAANNLILSKAVEYGKELDLELLHLGGGLSDNEKDKLFEFKRSFAKGENNIKRFSTAAKIYDISTYDKLCELAENMTGRNLITGYFPAYRG